ncbi:MAG TPA: RES family NAD+ phosphorylase [Candidatus Baltobacteraceae bacterium]|nr:RES family NAD+ phosphorylase [Candidatus Baltobacteraceae bacterium]
MVARFRKKRTFRVIAHRRNEERIADRLPSVTDRGALDEIEAVSKPRNEIVIASFAYSGASRFTDGSYGVYYAAFEERTAIAESAYHTARFLTYTNTPATVLYKRVLRADVRGAYDDIRARPATDAIYDPDPANYAAAQAYALPLYAANVVDGIVYRSVRVANGTCIAAFRPRLVANCVTAGLLAYAFDGATIDEIFAIEPIV